MRRCVRVLTERLNGEPRRVRCHREALAGSTFCGPCGTAAARARGDARKHRAHTGRRRARRQGGPR